MADFDVRLTRNLIAHEGLSTEALARERRAGTREQVRRGAWAGPSRLDAKQAHLRLARAVSLQRIDVVLSHTTAAVALGLPVDTATLGRVCAVRRSGGHGRTSRDVIEYSDPLGRDDIAVVGGLLVTNVARTVVDVARTASFEWGVAAADAALHRGLCSHAELAAAVQQAKGRRGAEKARSVLAFANDLAESPLESISRVQFARMGIPTPRIQVPIHLDGRKVATVDFAWEEQRLVGEADGAGKYGELLQPGKTAREAVMNEKRREGNIRAAGWWVVRWGMAEAVDQHRLAAIVVPQLDWADPRPHPRVPY